MGIGEPMDNFDNVVNSLEVLSCPKGFNMSLRHVSVSTCGIVPRIYELAEKKLGITLSISLHASNNKSRSEIMPVNDRYDINELLAACRYYFKVTGNLHGQGKACQSRQRHRPALRDEGGACGASGRICLSCEYNPC